MVRQIEIKVIFTKMIEDPKPESYDGETDIYEMAHMEEEQLKENPDILDEYISGIEPEIEVNVLVSTEIK
jgi:hypothetical protein